MITARDKKFFEVAKSIAALSTWGDKPSEQVGAIIVLRNEVISTGYNRCKSSPLQGFWAAKAGVHHEGIHNAIWTHAEMSALGKVIYKDIDLHLAKIYVYRETTLGLGMARPCVICAPALKYHKISNIYYTTTEGFAYEKFI
jgi:deoxycytidylate deaminase